MSELKKQTVSGIKWLVGSSFLQKAISTGATIVLARILGPSEFGLFALAFVAIDALGLFKSMGFDSALIQRKEEVEKAANTAFFIIPVLGIALYLMLFLAAPFVGRFLNNAQVVPVIKALGVIFVISCFGKVPAALLEKQMRFKHVSMIEISTAVVYAVSAIAFAVSGFGVWSLVVAYVLKTLYQNVFFFFVSRWRPRWEFNRKIALEMFHFGKFIFLGAIVWFLKMNLDNLLVGKLLGVTALGLYAIAFNVANFSADYFGNKVQRVIFPAYSNLQGDVNNLRSVTLKVFKYVSFIALPFGIGLFFLSGEFLRIVYGEKWIGAIGILRILALAGIFNTLHGSLGPIFLALGKPRIAFFVALLQISLLFVLIIPMIKLYGINGVGVVVVMTSIITASIVLILLKKLLFLKLTTIYSNIRPALLSSLLMGIVVYLFKNIFLKINPGISLKFILISSLIISVIIYSISLSRMEKGFFGKIKNLILQ